MPMFPEPSTSPSVDATPSRLAVIYAVRGGLANIQKTLDCLHSQTAADRIDLLLITDSVTLLQDAEHYVRSCGVLVNPRFLLDLSSELASARVMAAKEASAEIMAIAEDHCFPEANFVEELLGVFDAAPEILAASPVMHNPNPGSAVSRAQFLLNHGVLEPGPSAQRTAEVTRLPWHNTTYRRAAYVAAARDVGLMEAEGLLQAEIRRNHPGTRFVRCHHTALWHVNMSLLAPTLRHAFHSGRIFGAERVKYHRWGWGQRLLRGVLFPLAALLKMVRCGPILLDRHSLGRTLATVATACLLSLTHAVGEAVGIVLGKGDSGINHARYECDRAGFLNPAERYLLCSDTALRQADASRHRAHPEHPAV
jgi:hypothetical protein